MITLLNKTYTADYKAYLFLTMKGKKGSFCKRLENDVIYQWLSKNKR